MELNIDVIEKKISFIKDYLADLEKVAGLSLDEYKSDLFRKRGIEKTLINVVQAAIDINNYILAKSKKIIADDNYDSFIKLGEQNILPPEFAEKIAPAAGLRSRLVHEYDKIDDATAYEAIKDALSQFSTYADYILSFVKKPDKE